MMMNSVLTTKMVRSIVTLWIVVTFAFIALRLSGDPLDVLVGDQATLATVERYKERFGLDRPLWQQYVSYIGNVMVGDFGLSLSDQRPAIELVAEALPYTLQLGLVSFGGALLLGLVCGIIAALTRNSVLDRIVMGIAVLGFSVPNFFLGILLIILFSLTLRVLPSSGTGSIWHLVMPALTLGLHFAGLFARFTRSAMLEVLNKQFMISASARGVSLWRRVFHHAFPNAAIPIVTIVGLKFADLVAGSIIVETVFGWPGVGRLLVNGITARDFALVQAILIMVSVATILTNLLVDVIYTLIDPRMRAARSGD
jgi:peptide/nickel transport system permease protein